MVSSYRAGRSLDFEFIADPPNPRVGDSVALTVKVRSDFPGGLPIYRLDGVAPFLSGNTDPVAGCCGVGDDIEYELRAESAGTAALAMSVEYETEFGCPGNEFFGFEIETSETFRLRITGATLGRCTGDCNGDTRVAINEAITCVNIGLGAQSVDVCTICDANDDGAVGISEIVQAVGIGIGQLSCVTDPL